MSLLVMGTVALDDITTECGSQKNILGGSAAHFAMSASIFTRVGVAGVVGADFPKRFMNLFARKKIDTSCIQVQEGKTFHWTGAYDAKDWNTAITKKTELGVIESYDPFISEKMKKAQYVFLANTDPASQLKFLKEAKSAKFVGLDSMNLWITHMKKDLLAVIKKVDLFVVNDTEAKMLTGETNLIKAAKAMRKLGPKYIVVKKGEHGVMFTCDKFSFAFPAYPVERVVDPTGAGDTFAGGLMGYLARKKRMTKDTVKRACLSATICSSFNVEGFGPAKTTPLTLKDVQKRLRDFMNFISLPKKG